MGSEWLSLPASITSSYATCAQHEGSAVCTQDAIQGRLDFERLNSIMNGLIEDNEAAGWLEENPNSIAGHILKLKDHKGKPLSRARLIQVLSLIQVF